MEIQEEITFFQEVFNNIYYKNVPVCGLEGSVEFPVHVTLDAPIVFHDGEEIGPGNYNKVALFQGQVSIEIRGKVSPRFVPLDASKKKQRRSR